MRNRIAGAAVGVLRWSRRRGRRRHLAADHRGDRHWANRQQRHGISWITLDCPFHWVRRRTSNALAQL